MRVLQVHNQYRIRGGEDAVAESTVRMLTRHGIDVSVLTRNSETIGGSLLRKVYAFGSGAYSFSAASQEGRSGVRHRNEKGCSASNITPNGPERGRGYHIS
jgi:hypothetical protein